MNINNELHRNINNGSQFNKYFENVNCSATFEKQGDTTEVLHLMKKHALKYAYQTKEIAQQLKGSTVKQTVNNIYNFLYNNVQYNLDGYEQNLRSPACSWKQRAEGIDCKSYSIFASTILQNLGIEHYFRKVKQKHYQPKYWTHVYVVVKDRNKQLVIDPTIHSNNEVEYVQKKDIKVNKLPIYSLNAGVQQAPATRDNEILNGFFEVSNVLKTIGVAQATIASIESKVQQAYYKHKNFDFPFKLLPNDLLLVDGLKIPLFPKGLNGGASLYHSLNAGFDLSMFNTGGGGLNTTLASTTPIGVSAGGSNFFTSGGTGGQILSQVGSQSGNKLVTAGAALLTDPTGISSIMSLLPIGDIMANVSNVMKYGLSSWGATTSPEGIQAKINELNAYVQSVLSQGQPDQALTIFNKELKRLLTYYTHIRANHARAGSTKKAYDLMKKTLNDFLGKEQEILNSLKSAGYSFSVQQAVASGVVNIFQDKSGHNVNTDAHNKNNPFQTTYNLYTITGVPQQQAPATTQGQEQPKLDANGNVIPEKKSSIALPASLLTAAVLIAKVI